MFVLKLCARSAVRQAIVAEESNQRELQAFLDRYVPGGVTLRLTEKGYVVMPNLPEDPWSEPRSAYPIYTLDLSGQGMYLSGSVVVSFGSVFIEGKDGVFLQTGDTVYDLFARVSEDE